jgi:hypothetical protein
MSKSNDVCNAGFHIIDISRFGPKLISNKAKICLLVSEQFPFLSNSVSEIELYFCPQVLSFRLSPSIGSKILLRTEAEISLRNAV